MNAPTLGELDDAQLHRLLRREGVFLRTGPFVSRVRTGAAAIARGLRTLYADFPLARPDFADFHTRFLLPRSHRRFLRPKLHFFIDDEEPFLPLPAIHALPLFEWALNWCMSFRLQRHLIIHAAVVEKHGRAALLPGVPGAGKSTLCAALVLRGGWRLLSDELALIQPEDGRLAPIARPISLKNQSIDVIRRLAPHAVLSDPAPGTNKGAVAHVMPPRDSVARMDQTALPGWVVFPSYRAGSPTQVKPRDRSLTFMALADHAFNYSAQGEAGFHLLADLVDRCHCRQFIYSDLDEALATFDHWARHDG